MRIRPLLLTVLLAAAAPAMAAEPPPAARDSAPATTAERDRDAETVDRHCLRETGTHIRARTGQRRCSPFAGRVWTREDLDRTGHTDIASALRTLDVSIR
jgi:hypothetical protein